MHDQQPTGPKDSRTSSSSTMWLVLGMCFFLFGGLVLLVVGAGFIWFLRVESAQTSVNFGTTTYSSPQPYVVMEEEFPVEELVGSDPIQLEIDAQGTYPIAGEQLEAAALSERLEALMKEGNGKNSVQIKVSEKSPLELLTQAKEICNKLNVTTVILTTAEPPTE